MSKIKIAIIGGSGLDEPGILKNAKEINPLTPFGATAAPLVCGQIEGVEAVVLARHGRGHTIMPTKVPYRANIWALKQAGCTHIIATTACGSLKEKIKPRDLVFLDQFIDFTKHRNLTFFEDKVVHTAMAEPFCPELRRILIKAARELKLAEVLAARPGEVLSRDALLNAVWGVDYFGTTRTLDQHIAKLRQKIEDDPANPQYILTVHRQRYRFPSQ